MKSSGIGSYKNTIHNLLAACKNKYFLIIIGVIWFSFITTNNVAAVYYAKYILGDINVVSVLFAISITPTLIGVLFVPWFVKKIGIRNTNILTLTVSIIAYMFMIIFEGNLTVFYTMVAISSLGACGFNSTKLSMTGDAMLYHKWRFGEDQAVGISFAAHNMVRKFAMAARSAILGLLLAVGGYISAENAVQSVSSLIAIRGPRTYTVHYVP